MHDVMMAFQGKTVRIYTVSAVESYLGTLEEVKEEYVVIKSQFKKDKTYLAVKHIESFKEEVAE
jgi:ferredoxin-fold anticodon binding domain-containing protein